MPGKKAAENAPDPAEEISGLAAVDAALGTLRPDDQELLRLVAWQGRRAHRRQLYRPAWAGRCRHAGAGVCQRAVHWQLSHPAPS
jgi:hypothetical protein